MKNQYEIDYQQGYDTANDEWLERIDKIRAEIVERDKKVKAIRSDDCCFFTADEILEIIDKYKAETEET